MAAPAGATANLALVRAYPLANVLIDGTDLNYVATVMRGLGSSFSRVYQPGKRVHEGLRWNELTAAIKALGSTQTFPKYTSGFQLIRGEDMNRVVAAVRALNV